ncbi:unnamed protein product [Cuscuta epithymum]|uniref:Uncharacterized protein n=1 Tax=Cuscuta epithymum TaxID=186058 RepID=A0AAV0G260_9ASTE|nr:unnamed protein product [Cuscuta epithymum]
MGGVRRQAPPPRMVRQPLKAAAAKGKSIRRVSPPKEEEMCPFDMVDHVVKELFPPVHFLIVGVALVDQDALIYGKLDLDDDGKISNVNDCMEALLENEDRWIRTRSSEIPPSGFGKACKRFFDFEDGPFKVATKKKSKNFVRCTELVLMYGIVGTVMKANIKTREDFKRFLLHLYESERALTAMCYPLMADAKSLETIPSLHSII